METINVRERIFNTRCNGFHSAMKINVPFVTHSAYYRQAYILKNSIFISTKSYSKKSYRFIEILTSETI